MAGTPRPVGPALRQRGQVARLTRLLVRCSHVGLSILLLWPRCHPMAPTSATTAMCRWILRLMRLLRPPPLLPALRQCLPAARIRRSSAAAFDEAVDFSGRRAHACLVRPRRGLCTFAAARWARTCVYTKFIRVTLVHSATFVCGSPVGCLANVTAIVQGVILTLLHVSILIAPAQRLGMANQMSTAALPVATASHVEPRTISARSLAAILTTLTS